MADQLEIALNHDNAAGLTGIHDLSAGLFWRYAGSDIRLHMLWYTGEGRELDGSRRLHTYGLPYAVVTFPVLTRAELYYLTNTLCAGGEDNLVTARLFNEDANAWGNFNATLVKPQPNRDWSKRHRDTVRDVRLEFRDLEAL